MSRLSRMVVGVAALAAVALAVTAFAVTATPAEDDGQKIPVRDLPKNVVAVVKALCPGGRILSAEKEVEREGGKVTIEYEMKVKQPDGTIVEVEVELDSRGNVRKAQVGEDDDDDEHEHDHDD